MKEQLISIETAKLAKEKGFNWEVRYSYGHTINPHIVYPNEEYSIPSDFNSPNAGRNWKHLYSAPTQSLLQKWLREVHNIHIGIVLVVKTLGAHEFAVQKLLWRFEIVAINNKYDSRDMSSKERYVTYEDALEQGLQEALKLIELK